MNDLSVAVIGCGRIGATTPIHVRQQLPPGWWPLNHVEAVLATPGLKLVAVCDTRYDVAKAVAERSGVDRVYDDYRDLLKAMRPDLITIATRTEGRCEMIATAAAAGVLALHAEKPLCRSLAEAERASAEIRKRLTAFTWGATRRHMTAYRQAKEFIDTGELGKPRQILIKLGPGALQWTHPHSVDIASFFVDDVDVASVRAVFRDPVQAMEGVIDADPRLEFGCVQFVDGASALITAADGCDVVVACERGEVSVLDDGALIEIRRPRGTYFLERTSIRPNPTASGLENALSSLRDVVRHEKKREFDFDTAFRLQRTLFALALSGLEGGRAVSPKEVTPEFTVTGRQGELFA